jgi:hypothetical protein
MTMQSRGLEINYDLDIVGDLLLLLVPECDVDGHVPGHQLHHVTKGLDLLAPDKNSKS